MKIDFRTVLTDLDDKPIVERSEDGEKEVTLAMIAERSLHMAYEDEKNLAGDKRAERGLLALRIHKGETEFKVDEVALVKKLIGKGWGNHIVMRSWAILDAPSPKEAVKE